ncbi:MAG: tRNA dihydrouridine synthase DusB [Verrucomicrobia bacterium]|nr:tRNA dihydrouridine synthase DusB [Verrucomicrobiota bacterium]
MRLGPLQLESNLWLAPLAGYTALPFRLIVRELGGAGLATTELVNARSLLEGRRKALELIQTHPKDRPLAVQLFGTNPEELAEAARRLEERGADVIDLNMGCPAPKVCRTGSGSALLLDKAKAVELAARVVNAVRAPVTVKMRLGWDSRSFSAPELARALAEVGAAAVVVHGRTREQGFSGRVDLAGIRAVVEAAGSMPVLGNGDVATPQAARRMIEATGCAGVSIGRGAFYNPWIFQETLHYLRTGELLPPPSFEERLRLTRRHLELMVEVFGERRGCLMFRKIAPWHARGFGPAAEFRRLVSRLVSLSEFDAILERYLAWRRQFTDERGELLPRYRPRRPEEPAPQPVPTPKRPHSGW